MADGGAASLPAFNLDAEASVLSACLLDGTRAALDAARALISERDFYADANRQIWRSMVDIDQAGHAPDIVLVAQRLRETQQLERIGGTPYLAQIADSTPAVAHVAEHAEIVANKARQRRMVAQLQASLAEGRGEIDDVAVWTQNVAQKVSEIATIVPRDPPELFAELVPRVMAETEALQQHGVHVSGVDTGWREFTEATGGWKRGKFHVVGGRPGMGKSAFVLGAALNVAAQGLGVVMVSAEMTKEELAQRSLAVEAHIDVRKVSTGRMTAQEWSALTAASVRLRKLPLSIVHKTGLTVTDIRGVIRAEQKRLAARGVTQLGLVVVDYIQLLDGQRQRGDSREGEVSGISRQLTWMASEFDVPIIGVSQLNRSVESRANKSKRPTMADLRESGAIEQDAYTVTLLYRDEYYHRDSEWAGTLEAILSKNRGGPTSTVRLAFVADSTRVMSLASEQQGLSFSNGHGHEEEQGGYDDEYGN